MIIKKEKKSLFSLLRIFIKKKLLSILAILGFFVFLFFLNVFDFNLKNYFYKFSSFFQQKIWEAGVNSFKFLNYFVRIKEIIKENEELKTENQKLLSQIILLEDLLEFKKDYQEAINLYSAEGFELTPVRLLGMTENEGFIINKGKNEGIKEEMPIVNKDKIVFGKVKKIYKNFSEVSPLWAKESVINVKIKKNQEDLKEDQKNKDKKHIIYGVLRGKGDFKAILNLIPIDEIISEKDVVLTASLDKIFPENLLVGKIKKVYKNDQQPCQEAEVELFLDNLEENLFVITNYKRE